MFKNKSILTLVTGVVLLLVGYAIYNLRPLTSSLSLAIGSSYLFDVEYQSSGSFEQSMVTIDPSLLDSNGQVLYAFQGTLRLTPVLVEGDEYTIDSTLSGSLITGGAKENFREFFKFKVKKNGVINSFVFEKNNVEEVSFLITDIMESFDIFLTDEESWNRKVERRYGSETENYLRQDSNDIELSVNENRSLYKVEKDTRFELLEGYFNHITTLRKRTFYGQGKSILSQDVLTFSAQITSFDKNFSKNSEGYDFVIHQPFVDDINLSNLSDMARQLHVSRRLALQDPDELKASIDESEGDRNALIEAGYVLAAYLEFEPNSIKDVVLSGLNTYPWADLRFDVFVKNLVYVGNAQSQDFLMTSIGYEDDFRKKAQLIMALGFVKKPTNESSKFMLELAQSGTRNVKEQAELMLGAMLRTDRNDMTSEIYSYLTSSLDVASETREKVHYIAALGNSGMVDAYSVLSPYLESEVPEIKDEAIDSLRLINSYEATKSLIDFLSDEEADIRHAAAEALTFKTGDYSVVSAIEERLSKETDQIVLKLLLQNLIQEKSNYTEVVSILEGFLTDCGVTELCDYVKTSL